MLLSWINIESKARAKISLNNLILGVIISGHYLRNSKRKERETRRSTYFFPNMASFGVVDVMNLIKHNPLQVSNNLRAIIEHRSVTYL